MASFASVCDNFGNRVFYFLIFQTEQISNRFCKVKINALTMSTLYASLEDIQISCDQPRGSGEVAK